MKVVYQKVFTSGYLKGINVDSSFSAPDKQHLDHYLRKLQSYEHSRTIKTDYTGNKYYIFNVRSDL